LILIEKRLPINEGVERWCASDSNFIDTKTTMSMRKTLQPAHLAAIGSLIDKGMRDFKVPGLAIAIVDDERVLYQRGFGMRDIAKNKTVTPDTLFMLASISKSFTVSAMHASAHSGKFGWDQLVAKYLPEFALQDSRATSEMTVRDLVTHRSGLPRHDQVWLERDISAAELVSALKHLQPSTSFRSEYHYQNLMYMTAGHLLSRVTGMPWSVAMKKTIFTPLSMKRATTSLTEMKRDADHAIGYELIGDKPKPARPMKLDAMGPTGGVIASVSELARFVSMHIAAGKWRGRAVLPQSAVNAMQTPETVMTEAVEWPEIGATQYGMGWFLTDYRGRRLVHHGGNLRGFSTLVSFIPREKLGVVLLSNAGASPLRAPLTYSIYDLLLDLSPLDWFGRYRRYANQIAMSAKKAKEGEFSLRKIHNKTLPTPASLREFVGRYEHPAYGIAYVELRGKQFLLRREKEAASLRHLHHDVFMTPESKLSSLSRVAVSFHRGFDGEVSALSIPFEPTVKAIVFDRIAAADLTAEKKLRRYVGRYNIGQTGADVTYDQSTNALLLVIAPLRRYMLMPTAIDKFKATAQDFTFVHFKSDSKGRIATMCLIDSMGEYAGDRI
jgi:CubicO group peptidase (beta-lactamase class C family)